MWYRFCILVACLTAVALFAAPSSALSGPDVTLVGTVIGHDGMPREGAIVEIQMSDSLAGPSVNRGGGNWRKHVATTTTAEGTFELVVPYHKVTYCRLDIWGAKDDLPKEDVLNDRFGPLFPSAKVELGAYYLEQGVFAQGQVKGLPKGQWFVRSTMAGAFGRRFASDLEGEMPSGNGAFTIGHLEPRKTEILFEARRSERGPVEFTGTLAGLDLKLGVESSGHVVLMVPMRRIAGHVLDTFGKPIADAYITLEPPQGAPPVRESTARSARDGSFSLECPKGQGYSLEVSCEGYGDRDSTSWRWYGLDIVSGPAVPVRAGDSAVVVSLDRVETRDLLVLDGESGEPIPEYHLRLEDYSDPTAISARFHAELQGYRMKQFANGVAQIPVVAYPVRYAIQAKGFAPREAMLGEQGIIALEPGGVLRGHIEIDGKPLSERVGVTLEPGPIVKEGDVPRAIPIGDRVESFLYGGLYGDETDLPSMACGEIAELTSPTGAFEFYDLATGSYQLVAQGPNGGQELIVGISVTAGEVTDLGAITVGGGSDLSIELRGARSFGRLSISLTDNGRGLNDAIFASVDTVGSAVFPALPMGSYDLVVFGGLSAETEFIKQVVEVTIDEPIHLVIDMPTWRSAKLEIDFTAGDVPITDAHLIQIGVEGSPDLELGTTDANGHFSGFYADVLHSELVLTHPWTNFNSPEALISPKSKHNVVGTWEVTEEFPPIGSRLNLELSTLEITVLGADPKLLASESCKVYIIKSNVGQLWSLESRTDSEGLLSVPFMPLGEVQVMALPFGLDRASMKWEIFPAGEAVTKIVLDFVGRAPQQVDLSAQVGGVGIVEGLVASRKEGAKVPTWQSGTFQGGHWTGEFSMKDVLAIELYREDRVFLGSWPGPFTYSADRTLELDGALPTGRLALQIPDDYELAEEAQASIRIKCMDDENLMQTRTLRDIPRNGEGTSSGVVWTVRSIDLGALAPGNYELRVGIETKTERRGKIRWKRQGGYLRAAGEVLADGSAVWILK